MKSHTIIHIIRTLVKWAIDDMRVGRSGLPMDIKAHYVASSRAYLMAAKLIGRIWRSQ